MNEILRRLLFLPPQRSTMAAEVDGLHYFVIITTMIGAFLVAAVAAWFVLRYRRRADAPDARHPDDANAVPAPWVEFGAIGGLFVLFVVWWLIGVAQFSRLRVAPENALNVYVTGKQWMWEFSYEDGRASQTTLFVPAGRPVRLVMTSRDVIHSFYVPEFRIKQDLLPGRTTTAWFNAAPGTYPILCTEYCGLRHSLMRGQVVALEPAEYARWLDEVGTDRRALVERGRLAAAKHGCLQCHSLDGTAQPGPTWLGLYGSTVRLRDGGTAVVDEAYITESMMDPALKVHEGYLPVMPSFLGRVPPADAAAIIALMRALRHGEAAP